MNNEISFHDVGSDEENTRERRSDFNEDLLNSSGSVNKNGQLRRSDGIPSSEFILKEKKKAKERA